MCIPVACVFLLHVRLSSSCLYWAGALPIPEIFSISGVSCSQASELSFFGVIPRIYIGSHAAFIINPANLSLAMSALVAASLGA